MNECSGGGGSGSGGGSNSCSSSSRYGRALHGRTEADPRAWREQHSGRRGGDTRKQRAAEGLDGWLVGDGVAAGSSGSGEGVCVMRARGGTLTTTEEEEQQQQQQATSSQQQLTQPSLGRGWRSWGRTN
jgi:hypothetical protein